MRKSSLDKVFKEEPAMVFPVELNILVHTWSTKISFSPVVCVHILAKAQVMEAESNIKLLEFYFL